MTRARWAGTLGVLLCAGVALAGPEDAGKPARAGSVIVLNKGEATAGIYPRGAVEAVATVRTGVGPHEVAVSPDGRTAVVCNYGESSPGKSLTVIDLPGRSVARTIDLGDYRRPHGIVFLNDGKRVVITAEVQQALIVVDIAEGKVVKAMQTDQDASHMVCVSPTQDRAYVSNIASGSVTVFDLNTGENLATIPTAQGCEGIDVSPDGREVWAANNKMDSICVIDTRKLEVTGRLAAPGYPIRVKFTPDGKRVLVTCVKTGELIVFDAGGRRIERTVPMKVADAGKAHPAPPDFGNSAVPIGILMPPDGAEAYIATPREDAVVVVDLSTFEVVRRLKTGAAPDGLGYSPLHPDV